MQKEATALAEQLSSAKEEAVSLKATPPKLQESTHEEEKRAILAKVTEALDRLRESNAREAALAAEVDRLKGDSLKLEEQLRAAEQQRAVDAEAAAKLRTECTDLKKEAGAVAGLRDELASHRRRESEKDLVMAQLYVAAADMKSKMKRMERKVERYHSAHRRSTGPSTVNDLNATPAFNRSRSYTRSASVSASSDGGAEPCDQSSPLQLESEPSFGHTLSRASDASHEATEAGHMTTRSDEHAALHRRVEQLEMQLAALQPSAPSASTIVPGNEEDGVLPSIQHSQSSISSAASSSNGASEMWQSVTTHSRGSDAASVRRSSASSDGSSHDLPSVPLQGTRSAASTTAALPPSTRAPTATNFGRRPTSAGSAPAASLGEQTLLDQSAETSSVLPPSTRRFSAGAMRPPAIQQRTVLMK